MWKAACRAAFRRRDQMPHGILRRACSTSAGAAISCVSRVLRRLGASNTPRHDPGVTRLEAGLIGPRSADRFGCARTFVSRRRFVTRLPYIARAFHTECPFGARLRHRKNNNETPRCARVAWPQRYLMGKNESPVAVTQLLGKPAKFAAFCHGRPTRLPKPSEAKAIPFLCSETSGKYLISLGSSLRRNSE